MHMRPKSGFEGYINQKKLFLTFADQSAIKTSYNFEK